MDQRGECYEFQAWYVGEEDEAYVVDKVWAFAFDFAAQANVEWRIAIARLGRFNEDELTGA